MPTLQEIGWQWWEQHGPGDLWPVFTRLITQESNWRHYDQRGRVLTSSAGALGVAQLMPQTARGLGVNPLDPVENLIGGMKYFLRNLGTFGGDIVRTVAAYNAGEGFVQTWDRTRATLHNTPGRGGYPWRETERFLDAILGRNWESLPSNGSTWVPPIPIPPIPGLPSMPDPVDIGSGIVSGIGRGIMNGIRELAGRGTDEGIETVAPWAFAAGGMILVTTGLVAAALRSPAGKSAVSTVTTVVPQGRAARPFIRAVS